MNYDKSVPDISADFCARVVARSWDIAQRKPLSLRYIGERLGAMLPVRVNIAVMTMAVVFAVGVFLGFESYTTTFSDTVNVSELMEI